MATTAPKALKGKLGKTKTLGGESSHAKQNPKRLRPPQLKESIEEKAPKNPSVTKNLKVYTKKRKKNPGSKIESS